ncbi:hypothetical protein PG989_016376 [Apiospora arundinis]
MSTGNQLANNDLRRWYLLVNGYQGGDRDRAGAVELCFRLGAAAIGPVHRAEAGAREDSLLGLGTLEHMGPLVLEAPPPLNDSERRVRSQHLRRRLVNDEELVRQQHLAEDYMLARQELGVGLLLNVKHRVLGEGVLGERHGSLRHQHGAHVGHGVLHGNALERRQGREHALGGAAGAGSHLEDLQGPVRGRPALADPSHERSQRLQR